MSRFLSEDIHSLGMPLSWLARLRKVISFHGMPPSDLSPSSGRYRLTVSSKLRLPAACWYSMPRTVNVLVMLAIRYSASPLTCGMSGLEALRSRAVWCNDHKDSFEEVTSTENDVEANSGAATAMVSAVLTDSNADCRLGSWGSYSGGGCAFAGSKHFALATAAKRRVIKSTIVVSEA
jgi:hypothetical protein